MTPNAGYAKPTMKQSLTLFLSVLNFFKNNTSDGMTRWERLFNGIFVERKALMFLINGTNTNLYLVQKMSHSNGQYN